jgi:plasmid stabilization system protein ParE
MSGGYALHPEAFADLDEIRHYIAEKSPDAADRVISEIFDRLRELVPFPHRGHIRPDLTSRPLRFILVSEYLIAYAPDENPVWVVAVIHGRRNPRIMAAILRDREL